jgi:hypothetical protein
MKKKYYGSLFLFSIFIFWAVRSSAQNIGINSTGVAPNLSAMLDINVSALASKKGLLIPRLLSAERLAMNPLPAAAQGLVVYQTDAPEGFYYNISTTVVPNWVYLSSGTGWSLTGNAGTVAGTNFIGTTDAVDWVVKTSALERMRVTSGGFVGIGTNLPNQQLEITQNFRLPNTLAASGIIYSGGYTYIHNFGGVSDFFAGASAGNLSTTGNSNTGIGYESLLGITSGTSNSALGRGSLRSNTTGNYNTAVGFSALLSNTVGIYNTAVGINSLSLNVSGQRNTAIGSNSLQANLSGNYNTASGFNALLSNTIGERNTALGYSTSTLNVDGSSNTAVGDRSLLSNISGSQNVAVGALSMYNSTGWNNTAIGEEALYWNISGGANVTCGFRGLFLNTTGGGNVAIGAQAGLTGTNANANTTGTYNVFIGYNSGPGSPTQLTNAIAIGKNAHVSADNSMVLGGTGADLVNVGIGTQTPSERLEICGNLKVNGVINASGTINASQAIACSSDLRFKKSISRLKNSLEKSLELVGINYNWRKDEFPERNFTGDKQIGFIAQDVEKIFPQIVYTDNKGYKSIDYSRLTPVLVEAIKELNAKVVSLESDLARANEVSAKVAELSERIKNLEMQHQTSAFIKVK